MQPFEKFEDHLPGGVGDSSASSLPSLRFALAIKRRILTPAMHAFTS